MPFYLGQRAKRVTTNKHLKDSFRESKRQRYARLTAEGRCHDCGVETDQGCRCQACKLINAERMTKARIKSDLYELCSYCFKSTREPGITKCRPCADYCNQARARARQEKKVCECGHLIGSRALSCVKCRYKKKEEK